MSAQTLNTAMHTPLTGWDDRLPRSKRNWWIFFWVYSLVMAAIAGAWFIVAPDHGIPYKNQSMSPTEFHARVQDFVKQYETAPNSGIVRVPPGQDAYLEGKMWGWYPILELKAGQPYTIWVSSTDVDHTVSFGAQPLLFDVIPGHVYGITLTPDKPGTYLIYCAEYCGLGHQDMASRLIVTP